MAIYKDNNKTNDGRSWYFFTYKKDFNGVNKKYKSKRYFTKKEAQEAEMIFLMKRDNPINKPFDLVANDYFAELFKIRKESTVYSYKMDYIKHIKPYLENININEITMATINNWRNEISKNKYKITYLNKLHNILKNIFNYAMKCYGLESNPVSTLGRFQEKNDIIVNDDTKIRYITLEQFKKFISVIDDITWKTFFCFLYYTGMRKGEIQAITWKDIDFNTNLININKTISKSYNKSKFNTKNNKLTEINVKITSTKNNLNRKVKMNKTLVEQLLLYKEEMKKYSDFKETWYVFGCTRFMPSTTIDNYKKKYFKLTNIPEITIHEFRHSHVSLLINEYIKSGQTDSTKFFIMMSSRMGHSIDVMQRTYMHLFPTIQNEIVDILDSL